MVQRDVGGSGLPQGRQLRTDPAVVPFQVGCPSGVLFERYILQLLLILLPARIPWIGRRVVLVELYGKITRRTSRK
jgi:hypothetical protein